MIDRRVVSVLLIALWLGGCAAHGYYRPTVDPYKDPHADRIQQDYYECESLAHQASRVEEEAARGALVGGGIGMIGGMFLGALTGRPVHGAMAGATVGGVAGGVSQGMNADQRFIAAYRNCMRNRGHNVID